VAHGWNEITLDSPLVIPSGDLWAGYAVTHNSGQYPAGIDNGSAYNQNGLWYTIDGGAWTQWSGNNLNLRLELETE
jgi:hypothetical protein